MLVPVTLSTQGLPDVTPVSPNSLSHETSLLTSEHHPLFLLAVWLKTFLTDRNLTTQIKQTCPVCVLSIFHSELCESFSNAVSSRASNTNTPR
jgi:hypothetical protein